MIKDKLNIKSTLDLKKINKSKVLLPKRQTAIKRKTEETPNTFSNIPQIITKQQAWLSFQITLPKELKKEDKHKRHQLLEFLFNEIGPVFYLMSRTLEHAIKLLDIYYGKCAANKLNLRSQIYPEKEQLLVDFVTVIFMSSKYNEVYPPTLMDFINFCQGQDLKLVPRKVLDNQIVIFAALDSNFNVALVSDWWKIKYQQLMPVWAYWAYLDFDLKDRSKEIFEEISRFIEAIMKSDSKDVFEEFVKDSDSSWNVKEGDKNKRKELHKGCKSIYKAFVEFREKNELPTKWIVKGTRETHSSIQSIKSKERVN